MSRILALDTSTEACSVAVLAEGCMREDFRWLPRDHTRHLLPMVDALLDGAGLTLRDLDAIAFACGPGSFTGLRVCIASAQGLAFGAGLPVIPISTLSALAQTAADQYELGEGQYLLAALDARMDEVYWATYRRLQTGLVERVGEECLSPPEQLKLPETLQRADWFGFGSGWHYRERIPCKDLFRDLHPAVFPQASAVAKLAERALAAGEVSDPATVQPTYLRDQVAWQKDGPSQQ